MTKSSMGIDCQLSPTPRLSVVVLGGFPFPYWLIWHIYLALPMVNLFLANGKPN